ncbi:MAG: helix-turn-helix transcriptional regulator [Lachnospiraceae bacterium]|nr:helix-turn-helix transcriptional regulator [Lachnospiraceae bacterium]
MKNLKMKFARMEKDISQIELANRIGVTRQTIGMIESGDYNPSLKLCVAICKELGKTLNDLFWEEENDENEEK